mgnify:CR=1 FL=1
MARLEIGQRPDRIVLPREIDQPVEDHGLHRSSLFASCGSTRWPVVAEVNDDVDEDYRLDEMAVVVRSDLTGPCRTESVGVAGCASMAFRPTEYVHFFGGVLFVKPGLHGAVIAHENRIIAAAHRLDRLINDILLYSRTARAIAWTASG